MDISHISLRNGGGFVTHIHLLVRKPNGRPGGFSEEFEVVDGNDIVLGREHTVDLGYYGSIPEGSRVRLKARIIAGNDNTAQQSFIYKAGRGVAHYIVTGTTLDNHLGLVDAG